jgi:peptide/nickel transport system substrate-binding protein
MNRYRRNPLLVLVLALGLVLGLALGTGAMAQTLTVAQGADITSLDPHTQNDQPSSRVRRHIYETLVIQTEELVLAPGLAESWRQVNPTTFEFTLRQGVRFHNGDLLTANDVKFSFERLLNPATAAAGRFLLAMLDRVEVVDQRTVRLVTKFPFAPLLVHLTHPVASILNGRAITAAGPDYGTRVSVGTGPFKFVRWEAGSQVIMERNNDWWGGRAGVERLIFRAIPEGTVRAIELETGGIDIAYSLEPVDTQRLRGNRNLQIVEAETLSTSYVGFNAQKAPFNDVRVRQAINHAVDVDAIVEVVYAGQAIRAQAPLPPRAFAAHPDLQAYSFNPERARALLRAAGVPTGFRTTIWTNDNPLRVQIAEIMQANLRDVGIIAEIRVFDFPTYLARTAAGEHDMFILGWVTVTADADYGLYALFHRDNWGNAGNRTFWSDPRVDQLLDRGRTTIDPDARRRIYYEAQEIILREAPWIFLLYPTEVFGLRANVQNFKAHPAGHINLTGVTKR